MIERMAGAEFISASAVAREAATAVSPKLSDELRLGKRGRGDRRARGRCVAKSCTLNCGNTVVCQGKEGRLFEVMSAGEIVWEFWNPWGGELSARMGSADPNKDRPSPMQLTSIFRAMKLAATHPGLKGRTLTPSASR